MARRRPLIDFSNDLRQSAPGYLTENEYHVISQAGEVYL